MNGDMLLGAEAGLQGQSMAPFLTKLFQIVSNLATDQAIVWTPKGDSFVITDPETFARDILPTYFKHNNIRSFIRQLNTYGFRKRTNISSSDEHLEFFHEKFRRDEPNLLTQIKRCHQPKPSAGGGGGGGGGGGRCDDNLIQQMAADGKSPQDLDTIRGRVSELKNRLSTLQSEIRDYNQQMEQKVNILMHILQTSAAPASSTQPLAPSLALTQQQPSTAGSQPGMGANGAGGLSTGLLQQLGTGAGAGLGGGAANLANSLQQARKDALMGMQQPAGLNGMVGMGGLGMGAGLGGMVSGLAGLAGGAQVAKNMENGSCVAGLQNGVAGLQHLLEAAQRYSHDDGAQGGQAAQGAQAAQGDAAAQLQQQQQQLQQQQQAQQQQQQAQQQQMPPAKRICVEAPQIQA